jgi:hypothetical protein
MATCGEVLVKLLEGYGVGHVFGIPGVHTVELYRGLAGSSIRHITPRHEQGAGFMADGYARTRGKPGVCFIITGPGMTNITTAMGQAYADSIPMLVISSVQSLMTCHRYWRARLPCSMAPGRARYISRFRWTCWSSLLTTCCRGALYAVAARAPRRRLWH